MTLPILEAKAQGLADIAYGKVYEAQQAALMRLQLWTTGQTHVLMLDAQKAASAVLMRHADDEGNLDSAAVFLAQQEIVTIYSDEFFTPWVQLMTYARRQAAMLPFGVLAIQHERMRGEVARLSESVQPPNPTNGGVFDRQLQIIIDAMNTRMDGGMNLSGRIWRIDREARAGIQRVMLQIITEKKSAFDGARLLEQFLGANADCPRWTSTRMNMDKADIAASKRGLISGDACGGQGVSYNALRLARTEIQFAHHAANDAVMAQSPWVQQEEIHLSGGHTGSDICDEVVAGGDGNDGRYPVGAITLPLHPNCLCYKTAVLMPWNDFKRDLNGWMDGSRPWVQMDQYQEFVGGDVGTSLFGNPFSESLAIWLFEKVSDYVAG